LSVNLNRAVRSRIDVVGLGYTALDYLCKVPALPGKNLKMEISDFMIQGGGPAATAMVTVSRLGLNSAYMGKLGDDAFGGKMIDELNHEGVDTSCVVVEEGERSQFAFIMVDEETADRTILWTRGTVSPMTPVEVDLGLVKRAGVLLIDSLEPEAALHAARFASENGIPVVIDAGTLRGGVGELLPFCDYIVASEVFAGQISGGGGPEEGLEAMESFGPRAGVVTLGERGCMALSDEGLIEVEPFVLDAEDTTGAGDVFHGAFCYGVYMGWKLRDICVFSNAVAALKCRCMGGRSGIPDIETAVNFIKGSSAPWDV
jgi:sulfofructose kinase